MALFTSVISGLGTLARQAIPLLGGAAVAGIAGRIAGKVGGGSQLALPGIGVPATRSLSGMLPAASRRLGGAMVPAAAGVAGSVLAARIGGGGFVVQRRRRRMNVTNVKALRRSLRRVEGFEKVCKRVLTITTGKRPKTRFKRRRR